MLVVTLGALYLGWYRWPGWYLAHVLPVVAVMVGVDVVLGPTLTMIIANPRKSRRELTRDIGIIVTVQIVAFVYGATMLWNGRPLYYAFSVNSLSVVQAYDLEPDELARARRAHAPLAPYWNSLPRWIYAPLPKDTAESDKIVASAIRGGYDVIAMPRYYRPWSEGLTDMRGQLKKVDDIKFFTGSEKTLLKERMRAAGLDADRAVALPLTGRDRPLLAVVDPASLRITALISAI